MKLSNMKMDPPKPETAPAETLMSDRPIYPYGLQVRLDEDSLDKLGIAELPKVGGELLLTAKVTVTSVSSNEHQTEGKRGKHKHRNVELQITDMGLGDVPAEKDAASELYAAKA